MTISNQRVMQALVKKSSHARFKQKRDMEEKSFSSYLLFETASHYVAMDGLLLPLSIGLEILPASACTVLLRLKVCTTMISLNSFAFILFLIFRLAYKKIVRSWNIRMCHYPLLSVIPFSSALPWWLLPISSWFPKLTVFAGAMAQW